MGYLTTLNCGATSDYYEAIYCDLNQINISDRLPKMAFVGIKRVNRKYEPEIPKKLELYIQSYSNGRDLQKCFGCIATQVHLKSALYLIKQYNETGRLSCIFP